jgi:ABC-type lipoprotein export system ATPase subunit
MNLTIKQGEFVCIVGDVGSGKSSLLNSIIGDLLYASPEFAAKYRNTN